MVDVMIKEQDIIINYLLKQRGVDFSGYSHSTIEHQLGNRLNNTNTETIPEYIEFIKSHPDELNHLIDALIINVSGFFRDPLVFNYISSKIFPKLLLEKKASQSPSLRIWSAGCAAGEESYSLAMEISKLVKNITTNLSFNIFGTDIDKSSIDKARKSVYGSESLKNVRHEYLKHFTQKADTFSLKHDIKKLVDFSNYDLLDKNTFSPPESLYGGFDLVLCRNVLIYYNTEYQNRILTKLYRSLNENGYLVLGETEVPTRRFHDSFKKVSDCCHIYMKNSMVA
jgi:chemotaxis protein methyltransferase CheR